MASVEVQTPITKGQAWEPITVLQVTGRPVTEVFYQPETFTGASVVGACYAVGLRGGFPVITAYQPVIAGYASRLPGAGVGTESRVVFVPNKFAQSGIVYVYYDDGLA